jgi:hypothetical protein
MDVKAKLDLAKLLAVLDSAPVKIPQIASSLISISATLAKGIREAESAAGSHGLNFVADERVLGDLKDIQPELTTLLAVFGFTL